MNTFSMSTWILQSVTLFLGLLAAIPLLRAILGLTLVAISETFNLQNPLLRKTGIKLMPAFLRASLGLGMAIGISAPAMADTTSVEIEVIDRVIESDQIQTENPVNDARELPTIVETPVVGDSKTYVVKPGDSLWSIAQEQIVGPSASLSEIDSAWREIWKHNRQAIGSNPSLIRPGLEIRLDANSN